jgi:hypothetical protein
MTSRRPRPLRHALATTIGILAWVSAAYVWRLQDTMGPHTQPINVRFIEGLSVEARQQLERQLGLTNGFERDPRTWIYLPADRSGQTLAAIVQSPLIEDTAHIDRQEFRITLDLPHVQPWFRELVERERLPYVSWLLAAIGVLLMWSARSGVWAAVLVLARGFRSAAPLTPSGLKALANRLERLEDRQEKKISLALCLVFLVPLLVYGPIDDEEGALGLFSGLVYYRELLLHGRWSYWFADLGFGTPMPLGHRLDFHPVFGLGSLVSLRVALSGLWVFQVAVMAVYFRRLAAVSGIGPGLRLVLLACYLFSVVSFFNFYATDWVSCVVPWSLYPVIVYYLREAFLGGAMARWWLTTVRLGLLFSLWVLNAHPGYLGPLAIILAVYVIAAAPLTRAVYGALGTAAMFALATSAERIYFVVHEMSLFPADIPRIAQSGYSLLSYLRALAWPVVGVQDMRGPFLGVFIFGAAVAAAFRLRTSTAHARGCVVAFLAAVTMSVAPLWLVEAAGVSGVWLFRDPMVFFGLLSAGGVLQSGLGARRDWVRSAFVALLVVQVIQQTSVVALGFESYYRDVGRLEFYRHQGQPFGFGKVLVQAGNRHGRRMYLSARAQELSRGRLSHVGVHVLTDYSLLGLNPVNGWFKNVSMDRIHPSWAVMHGLIQGQQAVVENTTLLDVLGINLVVAAVEEGLAPKGLTRVDRLRVDAQITLDVFVNPDAWPVAVLLSPKARDVTLPLVEGCGHTGALCRGYEALAAYRLPEHVTLSKAGDGYRVHVPPSPAERLLFVSSFYRPEWVAATPDRNLTVEPIAGAFLGVTVPPGIQEIELVFRPRVRMALTWLSGASLVGLLVALGTMTWRNRAGGPRPGGLRSAGHDLE